MRKATTATTAAMALLFSGMPSKANFSSILSDVLTEAELPQNISLRIQESVSANSSFIKAVFSILQSDPYLWILVDKEHSLSENYKPNDLVKLANASYEANSGLMLRSAAAESLGEMAAAAKSKGVTLKASSAYRSYSDQVNVYKREVKKSGQQAADMVSARPGHSQHQLGFTVDFGSITNAFAQTAESRWLVANASHFGWSLSYPEGYEEITGYNWESWHYRYTSKELTKFIDTYFGGIQQYALRFLHEWSKTNKDYDLLPYEGQAYKIVQIGEQAWFAENLNYDPDRGYSACYDNDPANCAIYGRLYDWATAMGFSQDCNSNSCSSQIEYPHRGICPSGWHIPSNADWDVLMDYVGGSSTAGTKLKATNGWNSYSGIPVGTDQYGFSALPGGGGNSDGSFYDADYLGNWWSASESNSNLAYYRRMSYYNEGAKWNNGDLSYLFSVRCLQD